MVGLLITNLSVISEIVSSGIGFHATNTSHMTHTAMHESKITLVNLLVVMSSPEVIRKSGD